MQTLEQTSRSTQGLSDTTAVTAGHADIRQLTELTSLVALSTRFELLVEWLTPKNLANSDWMPGHDVTLRRVKPSSAVS
jgi:hypothetical protein